MKLCRDIKRYLSICRSIRIRFGLRGMGREKTVDIGRCINEVIVLLGIKNYHL
jgi:hypothetical protein